eukprot:847174-Prymnesium_polylepis.1
MVSSEFVATDWLPGSGPISVSAVILTRFTTAHGSRLVAPWDLVTHLVQRAAGPPTVITRISRSQWPSASSMVAHSGSERRVKVNCFG